MAQTVPFPQDFTIASIVELNINFLIQDAAGSFKLQAFIETGSNDTNILTSLVLASDSKNAGSIIAQAAVDSSGDSGILLILSLNDPTPPAQFVCRILLLQRSAIRYQDPRKFS